MSEPRLRFVSHKEHEKSLKKELLSNGIRGSIEIDEMCDWTGYLFHRDIQKSFQRYMNF